MLQTYRLRNDLLKGGLTGESLEALLERDAYRGAFYDLRNDKGWMADIFDNHMSARAVLHSDTAFNLISESRVAVKELANSKAAPAICVEDLWLTDRIAKKEWVFDQLWAKNFWKNTLLGSKETIDNATIRVAAVNELSKLSFVSDATTPTINTRVRTKSIAYSPTLQLYMAICNQNYNGCMISKDLKHWTPSLIPNFTASTELGIKWLQWLNKFGVLTNNYRFFTSADGLEWEYATFPDSSGIIAWDINPDDHIIMVAFGKNVLITDDEFQTQKSVVVNSAQNINGIKYIPELDTFVTYGRPVSATPADNPDFMKWSVDNGSTWTLGTPVTSGSLVLNQFVYMPYQRIGIMGAEANHSGWAYWTRDFENWVWTRSDKFTYGYWTYIDSIGCTTVMRLGVASANVRLLDFTLDGVDSFAYAKSPASVPSSLVLGVPHWFKEAGRLLIPVMAGQIGSVAQEFGFLASPDLGTEE